MNCMTIALILLPIVAGKVSAGCTLAGTPYMTGDTTRRDRQTDAFTMECQCGANGAWTCDVAPGGFRCISIDGAHAAGDIWTLVNPITLEPIGECTCPMEPVELWTREEYCTKTCSNEWMTMEPGMTYVQEVKQTCMCGDDGQSICTPWVNPCDSIPCQHGGACRDASYPEMDGQVEVHTCDCLPPYYGDNCELGKNPCDKSPCQNGGQCIPLDDVYATCECPLNFFGEFCETPRSCEGLCGTSAYFMGGQCMCDELCVAIGDCCLDYADHCAATP